MSNISVDCNPYEHVYRSAALPISKDISKSEAEELVRHLGFIYNTFGTVMKDFIKVVGTKFSQPSESSHFNETDIKQTAEPLPQKEKKSMFENYSYNIQKVNRESAEAEMSKKTNIFSKLTQKEEKKNASQNEFSFNIENFAYNDGKRQSQSVRSKKSEGGKSNKSESSSHFFTQFLKPGLEKKECSARPQIRKAQERIIIEDEEENLNANMDQKFQNRPLEKPRNSKETEASDYSLSNNPNQNNSMRVFPGRTKVDRQNYQGIVCGDCQRYYKNMGIQGPDMCECSSRHRSNMPMRRFQDKNFSQAFDID